MFLSNWNPLFIFLLFGSVWEPFGWDVNMCCVHVMSLFIVCSIGIDPLISDTF